VGKTSLFWLRLVFLFVVFACIVFLVSTTAAMAFYPGGTAGDPSTQGYSFFFNFFSDLGRTNARSGTPNPVGAILFSLGLGFGGAGLVLFSIAFTRFFRRSIGMKIASWIAGGAGVLAGVCFIGVALTPANLNRPLHLQLVLWAFRFFPLAAGILTILILRTRIFPWRYALVLGQFSLLLVLYLGLLVFGPQPSTIQGLAVQVSGQKVIAYASIISIAILAARAMKVKE
jgi:hypothetical protein